MLIITIVIALALGIWAYRRMLKFKVFSSHFAFAKWEVWLVSIGVVGIMALDWIFGAHNVMPILIGLVMVFSSRELMLLWGYTLYIPREKNTMILLLTTAIALAVWIVGFMPFITANVHSAIVEITCLSLGIIATTWSLVRLGKNQVK